MLYVVKRYNLDGVVDRQEPSFLHIYHRFKFGRSIGQTVKRVGH